MAPLDWKVTATDGEARAGILRTRRSIIETPVFMPVGTAGTVKGVRFEALEDELDARIILGNTYHLWLRPGVDIIRACGGLHRFNSWPRALLTDSGGFQVWSLGALRNGPRLHHPKCRAECRLALPVPWYETKHRELHCSRKVQVAAHPH